MDLRVVVGLALLVVCGIDALGRKQLFGNRGSVGVVGDGDPGEPLFVTPLIQAGNFSQAQKLAQVTTLAPELGHVSYSGYFTVNKTYNSNMFFWFFPSSNNYVYNPILLWLQGGPGGTSMFGLFNEHGPFYIRDNMTLANRAYPWTANYHVLYIDNPVGTGFSFTEDDAGYAKNEDDVAENLYEALTQFFMMFPAYKNNDFYATGESYAGKYVPAISLKIHQMNHMSPKVKINLRGLVVGDGLCDPESMFPAYAPFLYNIGLLDANQRDYFAHFSDQAVSYIKAGDFTSAFKIFDELLNGDLTGHKAWFYNQTGLDFYFNYLLPVAPKEFAYYNKFLVQDTVRKSIHVGNKTFNDGNKVEIMLINDVMDTIKPRLAQLLDANYKVLMYSGMLDIIVALPLTEAFLETVPWKGLDGYKKAPRSIWKMEPTDVDVAGYVRIYKNLVQIGVRGGGHILPYDQPARAWRLVDHFISEFYPNKR